MRRTRPHRLGAVGAVLVTLALSTCSATTAQETSAGQRVIVAGQVSFASEEARAEGVLTWGESGCMVIERGGSYLVVLPQGTFVDGDAVTLPSGEVLVVGEQVSLGGGFHSPDSANRDHSGIPADCLTDEVFWASGE